MDANNLAHITLSKESFKGQDGNLIEGVRITLAPMINKFLSLNNQKLELLEALRPNLYQWYYNSPVGAKLDLVENPYNSAPSTQSISAIYSQQSNEL